MSEYSDIYLFLNASVNGLEIMASASDGEYRSSVYGNEAKVMEKLITEEQDCVACLTDGQRTLKDVSRIYVALGPGSNTGIRMTVTNARVLFALNPTLEVYGASTISLLQALSEKDDCLVLISDRKHDFFYGLFRGGKLVQEGHGDPGELAVELPVVCFRRDAEAIRRFPQARQVSLNESERVFAAFEKYSPDRVGELEPRYSTSV